MSWTSQRVEQLAPDPAAIKAAQGLAKPAKWRNLGRNERLIWGECQGSGANPYQIRVDLEDVAYKCSCPSRKLPCKHTLGLLLLMVSKVPLPDTPPPEFVEEWSDNRAKRAEAKQSKQAAAETAAPPDPEARAKRVEKREQRIAGGLDQLEAWLSDLVAQGFAAARAQPPTFWSQMAARLIDAQAPGLARRVRDIADSAVSGADWQSRLLTGLARLQLAVDAYRNLPNLPAGLAAEVRTLIGWTQEQDALRERESVRDTWLVIGRRQTQDEQLRTQHTWLRGETSQRLALILEFAVGNQPLPANFTIGQRMDAEFVYFDSATPLRALEKTRHAPASMRYALPDPIDIATLQNEQAARLAANPWIERWPVVLGPVRPVLTNDRLQLEDAAHRRAALRAGFRHRWNLIALAGADTLTLFGEWDGETFDPLTIECRSHLYTIAQLGELAVLSRVA
jgi:hypothetical protein